MDLQAGIRSRLLADASVAGAVGTRVFWVTRPQATALPAIVLQVIDDRRPVHLQGMEGSRSSRVQLDTYAATYAAAVALAREAIDKLKDPETVSGKEFGPAFVDSLRDLSENVNGTLIHRQSVDLLIWHKGD
jgi:hypothetical protein